MSTNFHYYKRCHIKKGCSNRSTKLRWMNLIKYMTFISTNRFRNSHFRQNSSILLVYSSFIGLFHIREFLYQFDYNSINEVVAMFQMLTVKNFSILKADRLILIVISMYPIELKCEVHSPVDWRQGKSLEIKRNRQKNITHRLKYLTITLINF